MFKNQKIIAVNFHNTYKKCATQPQIGDCFCTSVCVVYVVLAHLFVKVPRPGESEGRCNLLLAV